MPNGIDLILADHRTVDQLFSEFDSTADPTIVGQILAALTAHDDVENSALYPLAAEVLGDEDLLARFALAHSAVKKQMEHLRAQEGSALIAAVDGLRQLVTGHVADEENELLPALGTNATTAQLETLGARILATKQRVG